jgi:prepilin-type N-terminal cleavage/methylation domain-containing protein
MTRDETGFTLLELLIAVTILGIIISALAGGIIAYMRVSGETADRLSETPEIQLTAAHFASDVQGADTVQEGAQVCGTTPPGAVPLVSFSWKDPGTLPVDTSDDRPMSASYVYAAVSTSRRQQIELQRFFCVESLVAQQITLVNLGNPNTPPAVDCMTLRNPSSCGRPGSVNLALHLCTASSTKECRDDDIAVTLKGERRVP